MENNTNSHVGNTNANRRNETVKKGEHQSYDKLPYEDPAITNPIELATYPKPAQKVSAKDIEIENETHVLNTKRNAVREGRNIINTDNNPDREGFM